jgi:ferredoxin-NADP reductase
MTIAVSALAASLQSARRDGAIEVRVETVRRVARNTNVYEFAPTGGGTLPPAQAGAHIDLSLPNGMVRQYSLLLSGETSNRYAVAVKKDEKGRGGSRFIHDSLQTGDVISISSPRNNFPVVDDAQNSVLIAGGIGITPIWSMLHRLGSRGRSWSLYYSCRAREDAAFVEELSAFPTAHFHFDRENDGRFMDIGRIVADAPADAHIYCCGPGPMLDFFESATASWPRDQIHVEYFSAKEEAARSGGFTVELASSGQTFFIPEGKTIMEVLLSADIDVLFSCQEGVCGACITRVISGIPDHRDMILSEAEKAPNDRMTICCSGSRSARLVLDL